MTALPADRLNEIVAQRLRVRKAREVVSEKEDKAEAAKTEAKKAREDLDKEIRILEETIDDKPAGPLYAGSQAAGTGPIPGPKATHPGETENEDDDDDSSSGRRPQRRGRGPRPTA